LREGGDAASAEAPGINDYAADNLLSEPLARFTEIGENEPVSRLRVTDCRSLVDA
jgi:D-lyxose ketol-isomerase